MIRAVLILRVFEVPHNLTTNSFLNRKKILMELRLQASEYFTEFNFIKRFLSKDSLLCFVRSAFLLKITNVVKVVAGSFYYYNVALYFMGRLVS